MTDTEPAQFMPPLDASSPRRARFDRFWLLILLVPPFLIFPNLGAAILWQDEAELATLARRITEYGYPLADDGRPPKDARGRSVHTISDQSGFVDINEDGIWIWTSWLGNYVAAGSFIVFGWFGGEQENRSLTFAARFPFALVGWIVLAVMYAGLKDITRDRTLSRVAVLLLMFSVPYLLFARQCRNYTMLALFTFLQTWGYIRLIRGQRKALPMFVIGGVGSYYAFFVDMVGVTTALGVHLLLRHRRWSLLGRFALGCVFIAAFTAPFFIYTRSWDRDYGSSGFPKDDVWRFVASLRAYIVHVHTSAWPFFLLVPVAWVAGRGRGWRGWLGPIAVTGFAAAGAWALVYEASRESFTTILVLAGLVLVIGFVRMAVSPGRGAVAAPNGEAVNWRYVLAMMMTASVLASAALANHPFFRYLMNLMPLFALVTAACVLRLSGRRWWATVPLVLVLIGTEFFQYGPLYVARRVVLDPRLEKLAVEMGNADWAHASMITFGHDATNGYTWTMLHKDGRRTAERPSRELEFPLYNYAYELTHDYEGPTEAVVNYLNEHAEPGETVVTVYEHFPLRFYTDLQVFRTWETYTRLWDLPDWIVRQHHQYRGGLHPRVKPERYEQITLEGEPCMLMWDNIPEPPWHFFRTVTGRSPIKLWRLKDQFKSRRSTKEFPDTYTVP